MSSYDNDLGNEQVGRLIIRLSFPAMAGMILYSLFALVDTYFVASLGARPMAAVTLCIPMEILLVSIAAATGTGINSLVSRSLGGHRRSVANNVAWHGLVISLVYAAVFGCLGLKNVEYLLLLFGANQETLMLSKQYMSIILLGTPCIFFPSIAASIIQGEGNTFLPMLCFLVGMVFNVSLDPILIWGWGPFSGWGLPGAAWATVISQIISSLLFLMILKRKSSAVNWKIKDFKPGFKILAGIYKVGFPALIIEVSSVVIMMIINNKLADYSYTAVAAMGIFMRVRALLCLPVNSLAQGSMPIAGFAYGAGNLDRVKETIVKGIVMSMGFLMISWYLMQFNPTFIMQLFSDDPALIVMGVSCMHMATIFLPFMGPVSISSAILQATGKGLSAMLFSLLRQFGIFLPGILLLPYYFKINGVWLAFSLNELLSVFVTLGFLIPFWRSLRSKKERTTSLWQKLRRIVSRIWFWLKW